MLGRVAGIDRKMRELVGNLAGQEDALPETVLEKFDVTRGMQDHGVLSWH